MDQISSNPIYGMKSFDSYSQNRQDYIQEKRDLSASLVAQHTKS